MRGKKVSFGMAVVLAMVAITLVAASTPAEAQTETVLYNFIPLDSVDGFMPDAGLTADASGNLYGTTYQGGANGTGAVFELSPQSGGSWSQKVLYSFGPNGGTDGILPTAPVIFDGSGNLYGTTHYGGAQGGGIVFELTPQSGGSWTETILHSFGASGDGNSVFAGLIFDSAGNLYGTTGGGGAGTYCSQSTPCGVAFELSPQAGGSWKETILHSFGSSGTDGQTPAAGLIFDAAGRLYGTTWYGGAYGGGTVFQLRPGAGGGWVERALYNFCVQALCTDGSLPDSSLTFDSAGNLYGTTAYGGGTTCYKGEGCGTVFKLSPEAGGSWKQRVIYYVNRGDGFAPASGVIFDKAGNLYGTNSLGMPAGGGSVFELSPVGRGAWNPRVVHAFANNATDGGNPQGGLIMDSAGNLYGTTFRGANGYGYGTVYEITP